MSSLEMRDTERELYDEMRKIHDAAEGRAFTTEECEKVERITELIERNAQDIRATAARESAERALSQPVASAQNPAIDVEFAAPGAGTDDERWFRDRLEGRANMTTSTEAEVIPKTLQNRFIDLLDRVSAIRQASDIYSVSGPVRVARQSAYMTVPGFTAEGAAADELSVSTDEVEPVFLKGSVDLRFTSELLADSLLDITSIAIGQASEAMGHFFEGEYCTGDGSASFEGLFEAVDGANTFDANADDLTCSKITEALLTEMPPQYMGLPRYLILNQAQAANLMSDVDSSAGRLLLQENATSTFANMPSMSILGTPILISSGAPTGAIAQNDVIGVIMTQGSYGIYDRGGLTVQPDPYSLANTGVTRVIVSMRTSGIVQRPQSIVQITS